MNEEFLRSLKNVLKYDPQSGVFTWLVSLKNNQIKANSVAGSINLLGYTIIRYKGKSFLAHRLAWLYIHGNFPVNVIDHINGNRSDNRIANLRDVTKRVNSQNSNLSMPGSKTGVRGVSWHKQRNKWTARIRAKGRYLHLGLFESIEDAKNAYQLAREKFHEGFVKNV